jgi:glycosyltransferase involved in cell wall biosynthesis
VKRRYDVCSAVVSDLPYDARVWKEARSLAQAGYAVRLLGCRYGSARRSCRTEGGIQVVEIPFGARRNRWLLVRRSSAVFRLWLAILSTRASAYHAHNVHVAVPAYLAARLRGARLVYDAHELYGESLRARGLAARIAAWVGGRVERAVVRRADALITTNPSRAAVLAQRHGRHDIEVLANVPALVHEVQALDPGFPRGRTVLLYQGGVYPETRAFRESVRALPHLPGVDLVILGFGRTEVFERIRGYAVEAGVSERVHFLPPRPFDELVRTAAAAHVGLVPIRPDGCNELLGDTNKLHEYLMAGLPVTASDLPEIRRVAAEGSPPVGELFDPTSPESIAAAVRRVLEDPETYERRRAEARRIAVERHNWQIEERRLLALYGRLAEPGAEATARPKEAAT